MAAILQPQQQHRGTSAPLGAQFARHMELRGHRIIEAAGVLWQSVDGHMFISVPPQLQVDLDRTAVDRFLRSSRALGVRFPSASRPGLPSGLYVYRGRDYGMQTMHRNFRQKVRHGLERCEIRRAEHDELVDQGLALNLETMRRQQRFDPEFGDRRRWEQLVDAIFAVPAMAAMCAFIDGRLAAYVITCREDGWLHLVHKMSRLSDLESSPNHVLDFCITRDASADPAIDAITMGWESLVPMEGLHEYKTRLGYQFEPCSCVIQLHPAVSPWLASRPVIGAANKLHHWRPHYARAAFTAVTLQGAAVSKQRGDDLIQCQAASPKIFSRLRRPFPAVLLSRAWWQLRNRGPRAAWRHTLDWLGWTRKKAHRLGMDAGIEEALGLMPGDWVEVKPENEIRQTLDSLGSTRGLKFLPGMAPYCGQRFRVWRRMQTMFLEESRQIRKMKNTVLLEGVYCEGAGYGCDRSCFFYWREAWLKRVAGPAAPQIQETAEGVRL